MKPVVIVHHHEIVLKRNNRAFFERQLLKNIKTVLSGISTQSVVRGGYGRFIIELGDDEKVEEIVSALTKVFGVANVCGGVQVEQNIEAISQTAKFLLEGRQFKTIRIAARRPDKNFPIGSMEVNARIGEYLCKTFDVHADLTNPDETIFIEIVDGCAYLYRSKIKGAGGLPSGISGKAVGLISAGFDSPVASWQLIRRGVTIVFAHFHSMPYTTRDSIDQVRQLVKILTVYQLRSKLYLIPFAEIQNQIVLQSPEKLRVVLYRRMMIRIAEKIAELEKAEAIVTGEAVGQVASQTLRNIRVIDNVAGLPILRPLSGTDKEETMTTARMIGTYGISEEPYDDCCSFLMPRKPETWADLAQVEEAESKLDVQNFIDIALNNMSIEYFSFPGGD